MRNFAERGASYPRLGIRPRVAGMLLAMLPSAPFASPYFELSHDLAMRDNNLVLQVLLKPKAPWKINLDAPLTLDVEHPKGARFSKSHFERPDALTKTGEEMRFSLEATQTAAQVQIDATLRFYLCSDKGCRKFEENLKNSLRAPGSLTAKGPPSVAF